MSERTQGTIAIAAPAGAAMDVIADLEEYPEWADLVREVRVLTRTETGRPLTARYHVKAGPLEDEYTLEYDWSDDPESVRWWLVEGVALEKMDGRYSLNAQGDHLTEVVYELVVGLKIPMIGLIKTRAEKIIADTALRGLKSRVESIGAAGG